MERNSKESYGINIKLKRKKLNEVFDKRAVYLITAAVLLILFVILAVSRGSVPVSTKDILKILTGSIPRDDMRSQIILNVRIPRALLAVFSGAALSLSGCLLQAVMQNPLADPGIIGVSSGAALMAVVVLILLPGLAVFLPLAAFIGGTIAALLVFLLSWKKGITPVRLVLAGVAVNALLGGANSLISVLNSDKIQSVILWINGSLALRSWGETKLVIMYTIPGIILSFVTIRSCGILLLGDEKASTLGMNVKRTRILLSLLAAYLAGTVTSFVGVIGFIGLVVPHASRKLVGYDYKFLIPFSALGGGFFLLFADTLARTLFSPVEIPVGTMMAVFGAPFFLYLLRKES